MTLVGYVPVPPDRAERYRRAGHWTGAGLADLVLGPPGGDRERRVALVDGEERVTYGELRAGVSRPVRAHARPNSIVGRPRL